MSKVANAHEVRAWLRRPHGFLSKLMLQALFRPLLNEPGVLHVMDAYPAWGIPRLSEERFHRQGPFCWYRPSARSFEAVQTADMWLRMAIARRDLWVHEVDGNGRVLRLKGLKTLDDVMELAEADLARFRQVAALSEARHELRHVRPVLVLPDGKMWVQLISPEAFRVEGWRMRHCLGNGRYWSQFKRGLATYYSLRDETGRPRVTVEVSGGYVMQARGTANSDPRPRWAMHITELCGQLGVSEEPEWTGLLDEMEAHAPDIVSRLRGLQPAEHAVGVRVPPH